ncbi:12655_t:CDS:1 [Ambispora leptoticha]|uniref:12655_t:CDS:1 n=1 Tax=Ambispora leptoticha TaxID=144679 RepID=A0A9N8YNC0_9GLOM|nr:12655_t:CDS:1 [Ambispora leptoticha]
MNKTKNDKKNCRPVLVLFKNLYKLKLQRHNLVVNNLHIEAKKLWEASPNNFKQDFTRKAKYYHDSSQKNREVLESFNRNSLIKARIKWLSINAEIFGESSVGDNIVVEETQAPAASEPQVEEAEEERPIRPILIDQRYLDGGGPFNFPQNGNNGNENFDLLGGNNLI